MSSLTIRLMSANGKGFSSAVFTMLNSPVAAAIPTARETTAVAVEPGLRRNIRSANRRSAARMSSKKFSSATSAKEHYHSGAISHCFRKESRTTEIDSIEPPQRHHFSTTWRRLRAVSYTHLRAHETPEHLVC